MKLYLTIATYLLIGAVLGYGIKLVMEGKPWLLVISFLVYLLMFARIGCKSH